MMYLYLMIPITSVNGVYSSNASEMMSGLGIISEHVLFATFLNSIGLVLAGPFVMAALKAYSFRYILTISLLLLLGFNIICGYTHSLPILFLLSLIMGVIRMFPLFVALIEVKKLLLGKKAAPPAPDSPEQAEKNNCMRGLTQSVIYFFFLTLGQIGSFVTVRISYEYQWQYVYLYFGASVLIGLILVTILMKPMDIKVRKDYKMPLVAQTFSLAICLSSSTYVFVYGMIYDWFDDDRIYIASGIAIISTSVLILQLLFCRNKLIDLKAIALPSVITAVVFFILVMVLSSSSVVVTTFMGLSMSTDSVKFASLSNWQIPGFAVGLGINMFMLKRRIHARWTMVIGFLFLLVSSIYMYFQYQSIAHFDSLILPTVIRSIGMWMIYAYCGYYGMNHVNLSKQLGTWVVILLVFRGVLGPVAGSTLYSSAIAYRTQDHVERIAQEYDRVYPEIFSLSLTSAKNMIQQQAVIATLKELTGWTIYGSFGCMIIALLFPYERWHFRYKKFKFSTKL